MPRLYNNNERNVFFLMHRIKCPEYFHWHICLFIVYLLFIVIAFISYFTWRKLTYSFIFIILLFIVTIYIFPLYFCLDNKFAIDFFLLLVLIKRKKTNSWITSIIILFILAIHIFSLLLFKIKNTYYLHFLPFFFQIYDKLCIHILRDLLDYVDNLKFVFLHLYIHTHTHTHNNLCIS